MLNTWAAQRKLIYTVIGVGIAVIVIGIPAFFIFYTPPSCTDGKENQDEAGVDCGGSCRNLCQGKELPPVIVWSQKFMVTQGVYSAAAYIENPNVTAEARDVPYRFELLDDKGLLIAERDGTTYVPAHKKFAVFEGGIQAGERIPARVEFEFTKPPFWTKVNAEEPQLTISDQVLSGEEEKPRIDAVITNPNVDGVDHISVAAIVYESNGNAIAASQTFVDHLDPSASAPLVFTWPNPYAERVASCAVPVDVVLAIDRSGSMASDSQDPPQPLTDVKNAASSFLDKLKSTDQAGLVSFATTASDPIDSALTGDFAAVRKLIQSVSIIQPGDSQNTNIGDGIAKADAELQSARHNGDATKVMVLLTDGIPTEPSKEGNEQYPEEYAETAAATARDHGDEIYTIGLGNKVNGAFLQQIATAPQYFFPAPESTGLSAIYKQIATAICKAGPTKIELIPVVESH